MALPKRKDTSPAEAAPAPTGAGAMPWGVASGEGGAGDYAVGGQVGQMHADLAQRLAGGLANPVADDTGSERAIRLLSRTGGYAALAAAYAGVAFLLLR